MARRCRSKGKGKGKGGGKSSIGMPGIFGSSKGKSKGHFAMWTPEDALADDYGGYSSTYATIGRAWV